MSVIFSTVLSQTERFGQFEREKKRAENEAKLAAKAKKIAWSRVRCRIVTDYPSGILRAEYYVTAKTPKAKEQQPWI